MYNILPKKLLSNSSSSYFFKRIEKIAEDSKDLIKVKVNRQDIENLISPKDGVYEKNIKEMTLDLKEY